MSRKPAGRNDKQRYYYDQRNTRNYYDEFSQRSKYSKPSTKGTEHTNPNKRPISSTNEKADKYIPEPHHKKKKLPTGPKGMTNPIESDSRYGSYYKGTYNGEEDYYNAQYNKRHTPGYNSSDPRNRGYDYYNYDYEDEEEDVFLALQKKSAVQARQQDEEKKTSIFKFMVKCTLEKVKSNNGYIYERIQQVGEGTYGKVYKGRNIITNELVALKKLRLETEREGFPITSHREIGLLQSFDHENIVGLNEIMVEKNQVLMIFPYMNHDLTGILQQSNIEISLGERKNIFHQLLKGINYLHSLKVIHRDIKGSNILIDSKGVLKITDFGLARKMKNLNESLVSPNYTNRVITLWYRPPEILLGSIDYGREVDMWGIGCILLELFTRRAIFQGINEIDQLYKVYEVMGTIKSDDWNDAYKLPWFEILRPNFKIESTFKERFGDLLTDQCYNLAISLLQMNPAKRMTASEALKHEYFSEEPKMEPLTFLKTVKGEWHEFEAKQKRKQKQRMMQQQQQQQKQAQQKQESSQSAI